MGLTPGPGHGFPHLIDIPKARLPKIHQGGFLRHGLAVGLADHVPLKLGMDGHGVAAAQIGGHLGQGLGGAPQQIAAPEAAHPPGLGKGRSNPSGQGQVPLGQVVVVDHPKGPQLAQIPGVQPDPRPHPQPGDGDYRQLMAIPVYLTPAPGVQEAPPRPPDGKQRHRTGAAVPSIPGPKLPASASINTRLFKVLPPLGWAGPALRVRPAALPQRLERRAPQSGASRRNRKQPWAKPRPAP